MDSALDRRDKRLGGEVVELGPLVPNARAFTDTLLAARGRSASALGGRRRRGLALRRSIVSRCCRCEIATARAPVSTGRPCAHDRIHGPHDSTFSFPALAGARKRSARVVATRSSTADASGRSLHRHPRAVGNRDRLLTIRGRRYACPQEAQDCNEGDKCFHGQCLSDARAAMTRCPKSRMMKLVRR